MTPIDPRAPFSPHLYLLFSLLLLLLSSSALAVVILLLPPLSPPPLAEGDGDGNSSMAGRLMSPSEPDRPLRPRRRVGSNGMGELTPMSARSS